MTEIEQLGADWKKAAELLGVECIAPYSIEGPNGERYEFACLLPDFGAPSGMLIAVNYDREAVEEAGKLGYTHSSMSADNRLPFEIDSFMECLRDWGWVNSDKQSPSWY